MLAQKLEKVAKRKRVASDSGPSSETVKRPKFARAKVQKVKERESIRSVHIPPNRSVYAQFN